MTTTRISSAGISALAALVHELRPEWDRRGIAAAVHRLAETIPSGPLALAFIKGCSDQTNQTPAALVHLENRAWEGGWPKCEQHPESRARRTNGECASCYADRKGDPGSTARFNRRGVPDSARALVASRRTEA